MLKHNQTFRLSAFDLFVGLVLKRLRKLSVKWGYIIKPDGIRGAFRTLSNIEDGTLWLFLQKSPSEMFGRVPNAALTDYPNFIKDNICNTQNLFRGCLQRICKNKCEAWVIRIKRWLICFHYEMLAHKNFIRFDWLSFSARILYLKQ